MGGTDPIEPIEPFDPFETDEKRASVSRVSAAPSERPDWLVGADAGVDAERERRDREASTPTEAPALRRPEATADESAPRRSAPPPPVKLMQNAAPAPPPPAAPPKAVAWAAAASSLPTLRVLKGGAPEAPREVNPDARFAPDLRLAPEPRYTPPPVPIDEEDEVAFPDDGIASSPAGAAAARLNAAATKPVAVRPAGPREAWWLIAIDALRTDRKIQLLAGLCVLLLAVLAFWPRGEKSLAIGEIRRHPQTWDGRKVRVSGRVGEVFPVGGGYAFNLEQGRDTLVVFTRSRTPRERDRVAVSGTITTGWLDGLPRQALFEDLVR